MESLAWTVTAKAEPMQLEHRDLEVAADDVIVAVAGCGVCHTDLGFFYDGVPTRHPLPLTLGHEVSGVVVAAGADASSWVGRSVIVPAVIPCGACAACDSGRGSICPGQIFPGNDVHGGFASHLVVPARGLCPVPDLADDRVNPSRLELSTLSVIADAVTTPYQAVMRSGLETGDLAVFVGIGGVGGFGVQIAAALGAHVIAIDIEADRLNSIQRHGAAATLDASRLGFRELRGAVRAFAEEHEIPTWRRRVFETSGTKSGQRTAFGLLERGGYLSIVGFTPDKVEVRLSNLMAFDAIVEGNWGCLPQHYPAALDLVLSGSIVLGPFVEHRPMSRINETFTDIHDHRVTKRVILMPD
jgi:6-hydroxycyclohex-1-ene-1-carbonyl-CoA dehydrogenase